MSKQYNWDEIGDLLSELRNIATSKGYFFEGKLWSSYGGDLLGVIGYGDSEVNQGYIKRIKQTEE